MSLSEIIDELTKHKKWAMEKYLATEDEVMKSEYFGMIKGYESSLILLRVAKL